MVLQTLPSGSGTRPKASAGMSLLGVDFDCIYPAMPRHHLHLSRSLSPSLSLSLVYFPMCADVRSSDDVYAPTVQPRHVLKGHTEKVLCVKTNSDYVVSSAEDDSIRVWHKDTGECTFAAPRSASNTCVRVRGLQGGCWQHFF